MKVTRDFYQVGHDEMYHWNVELEGEHYRLEIAKSPYSNSAPIEYMEKQAQYRLMKMIGQKLFKERFIP